MGPITGHNLTVLFAAILVMRGVISMAAAAATL